MQFIIIREKQEKKKKQPKGFNPQTHLLDSWATSVLHWSALNHGMAESGHK